jgi:hypothetical protein
LSRVLLLGLLKLSPLILFLLSPLFRLLLSSLVLFFLSQPPNFLLKQPILLLSSAVLSFALRLLTSSEFFDGKLGRLSRHGCYDDDDDGTKPSSTLTFICLGSVHGPIAALRA